MKNTAFRFLDGFALKIIALLAMTLDHVGVFIESTYAPIEGTPLFILTTLFRGIGRLAFPLFLFLLAEGMRHTHDRGNYLLRFALLFAFILIAQAGLSQIPGLTLLGSMSQPFTDLLCLALIAYLYEKGGRFRCLIALPVLYLLASAALVLVAANTGVYYVPIYLLAQYNVMGLLVFLPLYFLPKVLERRLLKLGFIAQGESKERIYPQPETYNEATCQKHLDGLSAMSIAAVFVLFWALAYLFAAFGFSFEVLYPTSISFEMYGILAAFLILLYSGKRGYRKKWWVYFEWLYFPVHIALLALLFWVVLA